MLRGDRIQEVEARTPWSCKPAKNGELRAAEGNGIALFNLGLGGGGEAAAWNRAGQ